MEKPWECFCTDWADEFGLVLLVDILDVISKAFTGEDLAAVGTLLLLSLSAVVEPQEMLPQVVLWA